MLTILALTTLIEWQINACVLDFQDLNGRSVTAAQVQYKIRCGTFQRFPGGTESQAVQAARDAVVNGLRDSSTGRHYLPHQILFLHVGFVDPTRPPPTSDEYRRPNP